EKAEDRGAAPLSQCRPRLPAKFEPRDDERAGHDETRADEEVRRCALHADLQRVVRGAPHYVDRRETRGDEPSRRGGRGCCSGTTGHGKPALAGRRTREAQNPNATAARWLCMIYDIGAPLP